MYQRTLWLGGAAMTLLAGVLLAQNPSATTQPAGEAGKKTVTPSGLTIIHQQASEGGVEAGDTVWVHYAGRLQDGTEFDASSKHPDTRVYGIEFRVGAGRVIKGWDEGILGMKVGEKRQLIIPPSLGYGPEGSPPTIPANATLTFDIELMGIKRGK